MRVIAFAVACACLHLTRDVRADDGGASEQDATAAFDASVLDGGTRALAPQDAEETGDSAAPTYVTACDGGLCGTTTGAQCGVIGRAPGRAAHGQADVVAVLAALALSMSRRRAPRDIVP